MMKGSKSTDREYFRDGENVLPNGDRWWCRGGVYHREDGPAVIYKKSGEEEWWLDGEEIGEEEYRKMCDLRGDLG